MTEEILNKYDVISSIVKNFALIISSIVGGIWAIFLLIKLKTIRKSNLELAKQEFELSKLQYELKTGIEIILDCEYEKSDGYVVLFIYVIIKNIGVTSIILNHKKPPVKVSEVEFKNNNTPDFPTTKELTEYNSQDDFDSNVFIGKGGYSSHSFALKVNKPGIYLIEYESEVNKTAYVNFKEYLEGDLENTSTQVWRKSRYISIKTKPNNVYKK